MFHFRGWNGDETEKGRGYSRVCNLCNLLYILRIPPEISLQANFSSAGETKPFCFLSDSSLFCFERHAVRSNIRRMRVKRTRQSMRIKKRSKNIVSRQKNSPKNGVAQARWRTQQQKKNNKKDGDREKEKRAPVVLLGNRLSQKKRGGQKNNEEKRPSWHIKASNEDQRGASGKQTVVVLANAVFASLSWGDS